MFYWFKVCIKFFTFMPMSCYFRLGQKDDVSITTSTNNKASYNYFSIYILMLTYLSYNRLKVELLQSLIYFITFLLNQVKIT